MSARTTREEARERVRAAFEAELNRLIPLDAKTPLKGRVFADFEDQVEQMVSEVSGAALDERAALDHHAKATEGGACPLCGSSSVYLEKQETRPTIRSPQGECHPILQHARCRDCGGSFSPSGARLGTAQRGPAHAARHAPAGSGDNRARL
jgi:hypothetical protein